MRPTWTEIASGGGATRKRVEATADDWLPGKITMAVTLTMVAPRGKPALAGGA